MKMLQDRFVRRATVRTVTPATPWMVDIRLTGPALRDLAWMPGQHVTVLPGSPQNLLQAIRNGWRDYTVWNYDPAGELDLRVVTRGHDGPGARWAAEATPGVEVAVTAPQGRLTARAGARYHLLVGEETASVALGAIARSLPAGDRIHSVIEVDTPADRPALPRAENVHWAYRNGTDAASSPALLTTLRALQLPAEPGLAYVAGEARTCQQIRAHLLRDRGWSRKHILLQAFWTAAR
jgi:NADPH-dependent ferric siderophore reductase